MIRRLSWSISIGFGAIRSWNVSQPKVAEKSIKTSILVFKVEQGHFLGANRKIVYDFILVINSNLGFISHRF